jgi:hypothetical protein
LVLLLLQATEHRFRISFSGHLPKATLLQRRYNYFGALTGWMWKYDLMKACLRAIISGDRMTKPVQGLPRTCFLGWLYKGTWFCLLTLLSDWTGAQINMVTAHNDIARTGQNLSETILTPANVNPNEFGQIFSQNLHGQILTQPLYVSHVSIPGLGVHNVVYVATTADIVYAFDGDNNGGINSVPLWQTTLDRFPAGSIPAIHNLQGVEGTPVISPSTNTLYVVSSETQNSIPLFRMHALDITTGAEKFGGPVPIQASIPGTGSGSSGGVLAFNPQFQMHRSGLLLLNGIVYVAFGSINDNGPWHGWIFSYSAANLRQINVFCTSPNGSGGGIWMSGAGLVAEVNNPAKPYGRMFVTTGNGSYAASPPYSNAMSYGMTILDLDLTGGVMTAEDEFTPYDEAALDAQDGDLGSGGPVLLPAQTLASGNILNPLIEAGKSGMIYILDRNNLGGFHATGDKLVQEVQTPLAGVKNWGNGVWGAEAYWNSRIYYGGLNSDGAYGSLTAFSFVNGVLSTTPISQTTAQFSYPGSTPVISANGAANGIVWVVTHGADIIGPAELLAYNATNLANVLYSSNANFARDNPGPYVKFTVPTIANGKVYVGAQDQLSVYGLLGSTPTVAPPVISPAGSTFTGSQMVTITDATTGAKIYYTTDGTAPTVGSTPYSGPFAITSNATITAIASATGYLQGAPASAVFSSTANAANPVFSLAPGVYSGPQKLTITDSSSGAKIYYTVDGSIPTTASRLYTGPLTVGVTETIRAMAIAPGLVPSSMVGAAYDIDPAYTINFSQGFAQSKALGLMQFNGSTSLDDFRLQLTDGGANEAGSAFYTTAVPIWAFTTDFTFQLSNPVGDGITFAIQDSGPTALGANARNLGYGGISNGIAIEFNIYNNSIGLGINGSNPVLSPNISLANTGINLASGDYMNVHITYDNKNLNLTITDAVTLASVSHAFVINIPLHLGGSSIAYVGFTGGTGGATASQKIISWTYLPYFPPVPSFPAGFDPSNLVLNGGAALSGTSLKLTDGAYNETRSAYYSVPVDITSFTSAFDFVATKSSQTPSAGMTFVIQNAGPTALGSGGGGLGYAGIPNSVAIKFDYWNDAGEGNDSTGVYVNGTMPTVPSINIDSLVQLHIGDLINVQVTYDGTTLTWVIHDIDATSDIARESVAINIPNTIGSNIAYIGFTGADGTEVASQSILDWTFSAP